MLRPHTTRLFAAASLLFPLAATAQSPRRVDNESAAWLAYTGVHPVSASWRLQLEAQLRQTEGVNQPQQRLYRTALLRVLSPVARVGFGYAHTHTYPPEEFVANPVPFLEHRSYQQFDLRQTTGPVMWDNRYRLEPVSYTHLTLPTKRIV